MFNMYHHVLSQYCITILIYLKFPSEKQNHYVSLLFNIYSVISKQISISSKLCNTDAYKKKLLYMNIIYFSLLLCCLCKNYFCM